MNKSQTFYAIIVKLNVNFIKYDKRNQENILKLPFYNFQKFDFF